MAKVKLPSFVVLAENYAWMENGCLMSFAADQIVRDRDVIRMLLDKKAPLLEGGQ